jgi:hydrogenase/urease accessory protein HupE
MPLRLLCRLVFPAILFVPSAWAHDSRPIFAEIIETSPGTYSVQWKVPATLPSFNVPEVLLPETCKQAGDEMDAGGAAAYVRRRTLLCADGLSGKSVRMRYPVLNPSLTTLFRFRTASGENYTKLLAPQETEWVIPLRPTRLGVAREYGVLGIRHILEGVDHLLFVLGLLLLVRERWMLLKTITSFTIAHSITLAIAALGYANVPLPPLNAAIALSIFFLGPEIVRFRNGETSLAIRHPWGVAFGFGLLHGFGFASGMSSVGLPSGELPLALLFFNVGIEIGQIGCVLLVVLLERSFRTLEIRWPQWVEAGPGYAVGSLGAFWTIQRIAIMLYGGS